MNLAVRVPYMNLHDKAKQFIQAASKDNISSRHFDECSVTFIYPLIDEYALRFDISFEVFMSGQSHEHIMYAMSNFPGFFEVCLLKKQSNNSYSTPLEKNAYPENLLGVEGLRCLIEHDEYLTDEFFFIIRGYDALIKYVVCLLKDNPKLFDATNLKEE